MVPRTVFQVRVVKDQAQVLYEFSEFRLDPAQRTLMRNGEQMPLTPKVFDTLLFLVQNSGRTLEKDELMKALWPESFVEEGNLSQNVFLLRKTLGDDQNGHCFIQTIPRRGYKFVAPVKLLEIPRHPAQSSLSAEYWSQHSPFRGLQVFEPDDAWLFFGRDSETDELLFCLGQSPILMVIGNSGCGKSSLIRAGLIPALRKGRFPRGDEPAPSWRVAIVRPTGAPFDYLAEVLPGQLAPELSVAEQTEFIADCRKKLPLGGEGLRDAICALTNAAAKKSSQTHVLLVVDQFEELFTLTTNSEVRGGYIESLLAASRWNSCVPVHLLLVLRADFYSHCLEYLALSHCLETNLYNVPRMQYDQLREAIERRLALAGAQAESGLIDSLLDDVGTEPGNLALLEHTLSHLWEKCGGFGHTLTNETYSAIGRLRGALSAHADEVYGTITGPGQKQLTQRIFLELVHFGEGAPDTRRRVRKAELLALGPEQVEPMLARLASSRLIAISGDEQESLVEVSHEALIREWSTLREWIAQNREDLRLERKLAQAADEWESLKRDPGALLQGARLAQGKEWLMHHPEAAMLVREFVQASIAAQMRVEKQKLRRLRWLSYGLAGLLFAAVIATWLVHKRQLSAESRALAAQSEDMLMRDQGRALDLSIRAWNTAQTPEAYVAITKALPQTLNIIKSDVVIWPVVFSPGGERVLTAGRDNTARIWNTTDGRLLATLQGHTQLVWAAGFSPDGQRIVTGSRDHTARIWNASDGHLLAILQGHSGTVLAVQFSPDGRRIVTASEDRTARIWNAGDGHLLATLQGHTGTVLDARFSPDGQRIATRSDDHTARIWNASDGHLLAALQGHNNRVLGVQFSPDGQRIVTTSDDHTARIWSVSDGHPLATLQGHTEQVHVAQFSPDGQHIVTASRDHTARIWNASDGHLLATLQHEGAVTDSGFSSDGLHIVTASTDGTARLWNTLDCRLVATFQGHAGAVLMARFSPDGHFVFSAGLDNTFRVWNTAASRTITTLQGHTGQVWAAQFSPDGQHIVTASNDHTVRIWNASDGYLLATLQGHTKAVTSAQFSPDGHRIVTASLDHVARIWNAGDGHLLATLQGHSDEVLSAQFSPDGQRIVTASSDHTARIWNASDGHLLATLQGHTDWVCSAQFSPDGQRVVTASGDLTARIWNVSDGHLLATLQGHTEAVTSAQFSPDGQHIVTASRDHTARIWNVTDGHLLATLQGHTEAVKSAQFSPDGQRVVTASGGLTARMWNASDGHLLATLQGHTEAVTSAQFSPDGQRVITTSGDLTARIWSVSDGHLLVTLQGHTDWVWSAQFSPDGHRIVTASPDQTARVWEVITLDDVERILKQ